MLKKPVKVWKAQGEGELWLPDECLAALGVTEGTRGTVRVSSDRLVLTPDLEIRRAREELAIVAEELEEAEAEIRRLSRGMSRPPGTMPDVVAALECLLQDELVPAIRQLRALAGPPAEDEPEDAEDDGLSAKADA